MVAAIAQSRFEAAGRWSRSWEVPARKAHRRAGIDRDDSEADATGKSKDMRRGGLERV